MKARCKTCAEMWNISIKQKISKAGYICPLCTNTKKRARKRPKRKTS